METKPLKFTNITADIVTDANTDADVMETQLYSIIFYSKAIVFCKVGLRKLGEEGGKILK